MTWNETKQVCEKEDGDVCPTTKITYLGSTAGPINRNDPKTTPINITMPVSVGGITYLLHEGNKCGITACSVSYATNYAPNPDATIDNCIYCPKGEKYNTTTKKCEICSDPLNCPVPPKGPINPIYIET